MILFRLFYEFFKTGLFSAGGGLATLPFLSQIADQTGWFTQTQLTDMLAVSESTPGPIGVNMATYVGFTTNGLLGAIVATLGLVAPSVLIILLVATCLKKFQNSPFVKNAFTCIRPASMGLIAAAGLGVAAKVFFSGNLDVTHLGQFTTLVNWKELLLAMILLFLSRICSQTKTWHPVIWILLSALIGICFSF